MSRRKPRGWFWWFRLATVLAIVLVSEVVYQWHGWLLPVMTFAVGLVTGVVLDVGRWSLRREIARESERRP